MPLMKDDLESAPFLTWIDIDYYLFHRATHPDGSLISKDDYKYDEAGIQLARVKKLFKDAYEAEWIKPFDDPETLPFEELRFRRKDVFAWMRKNGIIEKLSKARIFVEKSKLKMFKKLGATEDSIPPDQEVPKRAPELTPVPHASQTQPAQNKPKKAHPSPTTKRAKDIDLKRRLHIIYKNRVKKGLPITYNDLFEDPDFHLAIVDSGHERDYVLPKGTLQNWLTDFKQSN